MEDGMIFGLSTNSNLVIANFSFATKSIKDSNFHIVTIVTE